MGAYPSLPDNDGECSVMIQNFWSSPCFGYPTNQVLQSRVSSEEWHRFDSDFYAVWQRYPQMMIFLMIFQFACFVGIIILGVLVSFIAFVIVFFILFLSGFGIMYYFSCQFQNIIDKYNKALFMERGIYAVFKNPYSFGNNNFGGFGRRRRFFYVQLKFAYPANAESAKIYGAVPNVDANDLIQVFGPRNAAFSQSPQAVTLRDNTVRSPINQSYIVQQPVMSQSYPAQQSQVDQGFYVTQPQVTPLIHAQVMPQPMNQVEVLIPNDSVPGVSVLNVKVPNGIEIQVKVPPNGIPGQTMLVQY